MLTQISPVLTGCWAAKSSAQAQGNRREKDAIKFTLKHLVKLSEQAGRILFLPRVLARQRGVKARGGEGRKACSSRTCYWRAVWRLPLLPWCACEGCWCPPASGSPRSRPPRFPPCPARCPHPERPSAPPPRRWRRRSSAAGAGSERRTEGWRETRWSRCYCGHRMTHCPKEKGSGSACKLLYVTSPFEVSLKINRQVFADVLTVLFKAWLRATGFTFPPELQQVTTSQWLLSHLQQQKKDMFRASLSLGYVKLFLFYSEIQSLDQEIGKCINFRRIIVKLSMLHLKRTNFEYVLLINLRIFDNKNHMSYYFGWLFNLWIVKKFLSHYFND